MARDFDDASNEYLNNTNPVISTRPLTFACWFRSDDIINRQCLMSVGDISSANHGWEMWLRGGDPGDPIQFLTRFNGASGIAETTTGYSANTWHHACGVEVASDDRSVYIDGGSKGTNGITKNNPTVNETRIGARSRNTLDRTMSGRIAEAGIWNVVLDEDEITALARGIKTNHIRPANLVAYWPLWGLESPEPDYSGNGYILTLNGGPTRANHAPVTLWTPKWTATMPLIAGAPAPSVPIGRTKGLSTRATETVLVAAQRDDPDGNPTEEYALLRTDEAGQVRTTP